MCIDDNRPYEKGTKSLNRLVEVYLNKSAGSLISTYLTDITVVTDTKIIPPLQYCDKL